MKYSLVLFIGFCLTFTTVDGSAVSCSVIDYLYYSSDCCDSSNTVQCMESIPQTDKAAIDNLASLKRANGDDCQSGDTISYSADIGGGKTGIVCTASGPAVDCVFTWSNYSSCVNGEKTRTTTVSTPASGGGTACPASPETAVCTGAIGDACTDNAHCDSSTCDIGTTNKCVAAPTFTLVTTTTGWDVNSPKLMTEQECRDMAEDADLLSAIQNAYTGSSATLNELVFEFALINHSQAPNYPKGCSVRLHDEKLYYNNGIDDNGVASSSTAFVADPITNAHYLPVIKP